MLWYLAIAVISGLLYWFASLCEDNIFYDKIVEIGMVSFLALLLAYALGNSCIVGFTP
ncbi:MAG TPA: hypothetical protein P5056_02575 [Candidatus Paceibacterota bacterium]|nr:hypothetical protein [Candidatus Paceibacterota bacterium]